MSFLAFFQKWDFYKYRTGYIKNPKKNPKKWKNIKKTFSIKKNSALQL